MSNATNVVWLAIASVELSTTNSLTDVLQSMDDKSEQALHNRNQTYEGARAYSM